MTQPAEGAMCDGGVEREERKLLGRLFAGLYGAFGQFYAGRIPWSEVEAHEKDLVAVFRSGDLKRERHAFENGVEFGTRTSLDSLEQWCETGPWRIVGHGKLYNDTPLGGMQVGNDPKWIQLPRGGYNESTFRAIVGILNRDHLR